MSLALVLLMALTFVGADLIPLLAFLRLKADESGDLAINFRCVCLSDDLGGPFVLHADVAGSVGSNASIRLRVSVGRARMRVRVLIYIVRVCPTR